MDRVSDIHKLKGSLVNRHLQKPDTLALCKTVCGLQKLVSINAL